MKKWLNKKKNNSSSDDEHNNNEESLSAQNNSSEKGSLKRFISSHVAANFSLEKNLSLINAN